MAASLEQNGSTGTKTCFKGCQNSCTAILYGISIPNIEYAVVRIPIAFCRTVALTGDDNLAELIRLERRVRERLSQTISLALQAESLKLAAGSYHPW